MVISLCRLLESILAHIGIAISLVVLSRRIMVISLCRLGESILAHIGIAIPGASLLSV
jgi:hypothetical protein